MSVGFFTHGIDFTLPHPQIPQRTILLVCAVIERAWQLLKEMPPPGFILRSADEDTITQLLVEVIENRLRKNEGVDGFNCALFGMVAREPKKVNVDKEHPDKMPDIFFDLKREKMPILSEQDGIFVECKPIDLKHPVFSCYCKKGLVRFVDGDYAWAMQSAMMVGYVKDNFSYINLASILDDKKKRGILKTISHYSVDDYRIYHSSHKREFEWPDGRGQSCPIAIAHLWLPL